MAGYPFIVGIDVGISGAIAVLSSDGALIDYTDMPTYQPGKRNRVNTAAVAQFLAPYKAGLAVVEQVGAMPGQGVASMFSFGHSAGCIEGVVAALGMAFEPVTPKRWKTHYRLIGKAKDASRARAAQLFPVAPLSRKKDHALAEALLIAKFGLDLQHTAVGIIETLPAAPAA